MKKAHWVSTNDPMTSVCRQASPMSDAWRTAVDAPICRNCERIRMAQGAGYIHMVTMPSTGVMVQVGGWTFDGQRSYPSRQNWAA